MARAFAAEFLAPAEGIRRMLETLGREDDTTVETIARQFGVSPLVVSRQLDNQVHAF